MSLCPSARDVALARRDIGRGLAAWNVWVLLGAGDVRHRYKRSRLGQFWITLSMGILIGGIGAVYATLFRMPIRDYLPHLAVSATLWMLVSGTLGEATSTFTAASVFLKQDDLARTVFVLRVLVRNALTFAHNITIVPIVLLLCGFQPSWTAVLAVPGLVLLLAALLFAVMLLGVLATRFRDLTQVVQNGLQLLFFVTPVTWQIEQLPESRRILVDLNPFAAFLRIVSEPLSGQLPSSRTYGVALLAAAVLALAGLGVFARFRARLVYWL